MMTPTDNSSATSKQITNTAPPSESALLAKENKNSKSAPSGKLLEISHAPQELAGAEAGNTSTWNDIKPLPLSAAADAMVVLGKKVNEIAIPKSLAALVAAFMILVADIMNNLQKSQLTMAVSQLEEMRSKIKAQLAELVTEKDTQLVKDLVQAGTEFVSNVVSIGVSVKTIKTLNTLKGDQDTNHTAMKQPDLTAQQTTGFKLTGELISTKVNIANNKQQMYTAIAGLTKALGPLVGGGINNVAITHQIAAKEQELAQGIANNQFRISMEFLASLRDAVNKTIASLQEVVSVDPNNSKASSQRM